MSSSDRRAIPRAPSRRSVARQPPRKPGSRCARGRAQWRSTTSESSTRKGGDYKQVETFFNWGNYESFLRLASHPVKVKVGDRTFNRTRVLYGRIIMKVDKRIERHVLSEPPCLRDLTDCLLITPARLC